MKRIFLMVCLGLLTLSTYSQSKLIKGGNVSKVGDAVNSSQTKKTSPSVKKTKTPAKPVKKQDPDAKYKVSGYMEITGMNFANSDNDGTIIDDYGSEMYASEVRYLKPKIFYRGLSSEEKNITLDVKILNEDGTVKSGTNSPDGYSYEQEVTVQSGSGQSMELLGWGNSMGTSYSAGLYTIEIWYDGNKLYEKSVRLYSGTTPLATSRLIKIDNILFGSSDENNNLFIAYGDTLYEGQVQYLKAQLSYKGLYSNDQKITLFYRIFESDGILSVGKSSPKGFTSKSQVTIKPGFNTVDLLGWGNSSGSTYKAGTHKYELWLDGEKIYETTFEVKKRDGLATYLTVDSKTAVSTTFSLNGGSETFYVKTDAGSWDTWGVPSWCEIIEKTESSFTIKCKPNTTGSTRTDYMKIKADGKEVRIDIKQTTE